MVEIERKFLLKNTDFLQFAISHSKIVQGYLNSDKERTVRIRIQEEKAFLTIKGKSNPSGLTRLEWEKEIPLADAQLLLPLCEKGTISKTRYNIPFHDIIIEVDVFEGENKGLLLAEIELDNETQKFIIPDWLGLEVTGDIRYYNSYLSSRPFCSW